MRLQIKLDVDEFITNVSGYVGVVQDAANIVIRSLKFQTNIREFGPYGTEAGTPFTFPVNPEDKIIGFFGRSGVFLDEIGFHVAHRS